MKTRPLGNSGLHASVVGIGTWVLGGGSAWGAEPDDQESVRTIHTALDAGVNLIDTAPGYGWGRSEEVVGKAIKGRHDKVKGVLPKGSFDESGWGVAVLSSVRSKKLQFHLAEVFKAAWRRGAADVPSKIAANTACATLWTGPSTVRESRIRMFCVAAIRQSWIRCRHSRRLCAPVPRRDRWC